MSVVGINIKKLRSVKGLNQTDFASLFGLTRANIGSYEELRAEPKIETIIKIATYYKLSIDKLVRKELTVNDISNFDVFSKLAVATNPNSKDEIAFVTKVDLENYPKKKTDKAYLAGLSKVIFPFGNKTSERMVFYNEGNDLYFNNKGFLHGDILFLEKVIKVENTILGVMIDDKSIYKGFLSQLNKKIIVRPLNLNLDKIELSVTKKNDFWKIVGKYTSEITTKNILISRLDILENKIQQLENK